MKKLNKEASDDILYQIDTKQIDADVGQKVQRSHHVIVALDRATKSYRSGESVTHALHSITLRLYAGEFVIVYGPSGCGKSTLLHLILGLEDATHGTVKIRGKKLGGLSSDEVTRYRKEKIGMIFQQSHWIKSLNVEENVAYPLLLGGLREKEALIKARDTLRTIGIEEISRKKPMDLSGGQQQRVALARALASDPWIIMADEPTGNLDTSSGYEVVKLLTKLNRVDRRTIIMVTHDINFLPLATRRIAMKDGRIVEDTHD